MANIERGSESHSKKKTYLATNKTDISRKCSLKETVVQKKYTANTNFFQKGQRMGRMKKRQNLLTCGELNDGGFKIKTSTKADTKKMSSLSQTEINITIPIKYDLEDARFKDQIFQELAQPKIDFTSIFHNTWNNVNRVGKHTAQLSRLGSPDMSRKIEKSNISMAQPELQRKFIDNEVLNPKFIKVPTRDQKRRISDIQSYMNQHCSHYAGSLQRLSNKKPKSTTNTNKPPVNPSSTASKHHTPSYPTHTLVHQPHTHISGRRPHISYTIPVDMRYEPRLTAGDLDISAMMATHTPAVDSRPIVSQMAVCDSVCVDYGINRCMTAGSGMMHIGMPSAEVVETSETVDAINMKIKCMFNAS